MSGLPKHFLEKESEKYGDLAQYYRTFGELFERRLWHQLTEEIKKFVYAENSFRNDNMTLLFDNFIFHFHSHMNQLELARIVVRISKQYKDLASALKFLERNSEDRKKIGDSAWIFVRLEIAHIHLIGNLPKQCEEIIADATAILDKSNFGHSSIFSQYFKVSLQYYKVIGNADKYLEAALHFLGHTTNDDIPQKEQFLLAFDIGLAALLSRTCFNFAPIFAHELIHILDKTEHDWLYQTLKVFNHGDLRKWKDVAITFGDTFRGHPSLVGQLGFLEQKIRLMTLVELVFSTHPHDRNISFEAIAKHCELGTDEVELVLIRSFSLGLLKGTIDQVSQTVNITYVTSRTLSVEQIGKLSSKMGDWADKVEKVLSDFEDNRKQSNIPMEEDTKDSK